MPALKYADGVAESTVYVGTGDITLAGAIDTDHMTFGSQFADGDLMPVSVYGGGKRMTFIGRYNIGANSLTRVKFRKSSTGSNLSLSGTMTVLCGWDADDAGSLQMANRNILLSSCTLAKVLATYQRVENVFATGFKGGTDALDGIKTASSSNYTLDGTNGLVKPSVSVQTLISGATGSNIGNMTNGGGLAAFFNGVTNTALTTGGFTTGAGGGSLSGYNNTVGKDWGAGTTKIVTKFVMYSPSDQGVNQTGPTDIRLEGSNDNSAWTTLCQLTAVNNAVGAVITTSSGITTTTAYRYHRINILGDGGAGSGSGTGLAELQFYEGVNQTNNMTLVTLGQIPFASPLFGRVLFEADVDLTPTTDATLELSADNEANYATAAFTKVGTATRGSGSAVYLYESGIIDISAHTGVAGIMARLKTLTNKAPNISRVAFEWAA